jgi:DNA-binding NarL/FixJ family response regulator
MRLEPDVIVSDISMPVLGAFEARNELIAQGKTFPFVFVSIHGKEVFSHLPQDGSVALVYKLEMSEHLSDAVEIVYREGVWLSPFYRQV